MIKYSGKKVTLFKERFSDLCAESGLSELDIAKGLCVSRQAVNAWKLAVRSPKQPTIVAIAKYFNVRVDWLMGFDVPKEAPDAPNIQPALYHRVPILGAIAAGQPIYDEYTDEYIDTNISADCALIVRGNSMYPLYRDGDIVYIRECPDIAYNGQIAAVIVDDEATLKRVYKGPQIRLKSENSDYPDMVVDPAVKSVRILGKVVGFTRIFREEEP